MELGSKEYEIKDKFTLIIGKLKKEDISSYAPPSIHKCLEQLNCISIENFIEAFHNRLPEYAKLKVALDLPHYLNKYSQKSKLNSEIIFQLSSIFKNFKNVVKYNHLLLEKENLMKELEISKSYEKESNISTITELIEELEQNITINQKKFSYFEEDFLKHKNQIDLIKIEISKYQNQIHELNKEKKSCFNKINKITRQMETNVEDESKKNDKVDKSDNIPNSEKIKQLQYKARENQHQINQLREKIEEKRFKINKLEPQFKLYEEDHNKITSIIQKDKSRINELNEKLRNEIQSSKADLSINNQNNHRINFRSQKEIETEISTIEQEINQTKLSKDYYNPIEPQDLSKIRREILELKNKVKKNQKQIQITDTEKDIIQISTQFETLENLIYEMEILINLFMQLIKLKVQFLITINNTKENLYIEINFTRNGKEQLRFENLTTPEKVFFVIIFYLVIEILNNSKNIVFSNLFIPESFNKRGSIERTIKKIIPLFKTESRFSEINLIFIISKLNIKSNINALKLIKIEES